MERVAILGGIRTPFVKAGAEFKSIPPHELARVAAVEAIERARITPEAIDEVVIGNTANPQDAPNIARVIGLLSGIPKERPGNTVHRNCASGMEAVTTAALKIMAGESSTILCGGVENMSRFPLIYGKEMTELFAKLARAKTLQDRLMIFSSFRPHFLKPIIALEVGLTDPICGLNMGETAELIAREWKVTREEMDQFALRSHQLATTATQTGFFKDEITPVFVPPEYKVAVTEDIGPRKNQTMEALQKLKPYFDRRHGSVTAGNSCGITDGACLLVLASEKRAKELGVEPLGFISSYAYAGLEPERMGLGPAYAIPKALDKAGKTLQDMDLFEINEAFAAQVICCNRALQDREFCKTKLGKDSPVGEIPLDKLNVNGGAVAIGHPVGATGARLVLTLLRGLREKKKKWGIASLCIGGGQGGAVVVEANV